MIARHVAIILDGNRRFAKKLMLEPWKGHEYGEKKVEQLMKWAHDAGIKELTLYSFSMQNFKRPKEEFDYLMGLMKDAFNKFGQDKRIDEYGIKINILGRYNMFPEDVVNALEDIMKRTEKNKNFTVNFAMAYGGREEIIDAVKKLSEDYKKGLISEIDEKAIADRLYTASEPDIIIRTGGEIRTSNFLPWQSTYSEWFFLEKTWPEFEEEDLKRILKEYSERERRYGK